MIKGNAPLVTSEWYFNLLITLNVVIHAAFFLLLAILASFIYSKRSKINGFNIDNRANHQKIIPNHGLESTSAPPAAGTLETHP